MYSYLPIVLSSLTLIPNTFASYYSIFIRSDNHVPSCREIYAILMVSYPAFPLHCIGIHNPESGPSHLIAYLGHIHFSFTELRHIPVITIELFSINVCWKYLDCHWPLFSLGIYSLSSVSLCSAQCRAFASLIE